MTYEEQRALDAWLTSLKDRLDREPWAWKLELATALGAQPALAPLAAHLDTIDLTREMGDEERAKTVASLGQIAATAQRIINGLSPTEMGDVVQYRIQKAVDASLVGRAKWFAPVFAVVSAVMLGGTVAYGIHLDGLVNQARDAKDDAIKAINENTAAIKAKNQSADEALRQMQDTGDKMKTAAAAAQDQLDRFGPRLDRLQTRMDTDLAPKVAKATTDATTAQKDAARVSGQLKTDGAAIHSAALTMSAIGKLPAGAQRPALLLTAQVYWNIVAGVVLAVLLSMLAVAKAFWPRSQ